MVRESLEQRIGYKFRNSFLLAEAMTHPSLAYESDLHHFDNQRLEFLGDAVLQLVLTGKLYELFPEWAEGELTKARASLVSRKALADFAREIDLGRDVLLGKGEEMSGGRERESTLADAFEALLGAMYLDSGFEPVRDLVLRLAKDGLVHVGESPERKNPKGKLQEVLQSLLPVTPMYRIVEEMGPDHSRSFLAEVVWNDCVLAQGEGKSKKEAEAAAAAAALEAKRWES